MDTEGVHWAYVPLLEEQIGWELDGSTGGWWRAEDADLVDDEGCVWFLVFACVPGEIEEVCAAAVACSKEHVGVLLSSADVSPEEPPADAPAWCYVDGPSPALSGNHRYIADRILEALRGFESQESP